MYVDSKTASCSQCKCVKSERFSVVTGGGISTKGMSELHCWGLL